MKIKDMVKNFDKKEDTMAIYFGDDGVAVAGNVTRFQHVEGILAMISSLTDHCGGDATVFNEAIKALREKEEEMKEDVEEDEEPDCKIAKLDLSDKESVEEFIKLLKKASK